ncbi:MAG: hypothetical protein ACI9SC_002195 [Gammaproteobacteria bacterium]
MDWGAAVRKLDDGVRSNSQTAHDIKNSETYKSAGSTLKASKKKRQTRP